MAAKSRAKPARLTAPASCNGLAATAPELLSFPRKRESREIKYLDPCFCEGDGLELPWRSGRFPGWGFPLDPIEICCSVALAQHLRGVIRGLIDDASAPHGRPLGNPVRPARSEERRVGKECRSR